MQVLFKTLSYVCGVAKMADDLFIYFLSPGFYRHSCDYVDNICVSSDSTSCGRPPY